MPTIRRSLLLALATLTLAGAARAQDAAAFAGDPTAGPVAAQPAGPRLETVRSGVVAVAPATAEQPVPAPLQRAPSQRSKTLMIIGGAMLLGGAIVGDDVGQLVMLGGLGVGIYGLWLHLQ